jgi:hypothetical protein
MESMRGLSDYRKLFRDMGYKYCADSVLTSVIITSYKRLTKHLPLR